MSKKTHLKKKVNVKLEPQHSILTADVEVFLNMQKVYSDLLRFAKTEDDRIVYNTILELINEAIENVYYPSPEVINSEW